MTETPLYSGNQIFRNQPSYTHFNKSYADDPTDALFLLLNEIDPILVEKNNRDDGFRNQELIDPRTKQEVERTKRDYRRGSTLRLFRSVAKSVLAKAQQEVCLRVLRAWQDRLPVEEPDLLVWRTTEHKRQKEKQQMLEFLTEYSQAHREEIYEPAKRLVSLYKLWHTRRVAQLLEKHPLDVAYNTHTGLPHVNVCKGDDERVDVTNVQLLERSGWIPLWKEEEEVCEGGKQQSHFNCQRMHFKLEQYFKLYNETACVEELLPPHKMNLSRQQTVEGASDVDEVGGEENHKIVLPLESLLFLLTAGDYLDLPIEMPVEIQEDESTELKQLIFETPLPARNCGWHTHNQVVEQAYAAYLSVAEQTKWLRVQKYVACLEPPQTAEEIHAISNEVQEYKLHTFDEFLLKNNTQRTEQHKVKRSAALIGWQLTKQLAAQETTNSYDIFTALTLPPALNADGSHLLGTHSIKLEYKPQFGCELMTKYELLREWWRLRLLSGCMADVTDGKCSRIAISNFETQLVERLSLPQLEKRLSESYHIQIPQLLANLMEFLRLLLNMPTGKYLLRYNAKFKDKLMLCAPTEEITQNTIFLHALLKVEPSDLAFMTQPHILPIADDLCSQLHLRFNVLPCMFLPALGKAKGNESVGKVKRKQAGKKPKFINDREMVLRRVQMMQENRQAARAAIKTQHKRQQKARKRQRLKKLKQQKQAQISEEQQLQKEIDEDQKFFGC